MLEEGECVEGRKKESERESVCVCKKGQVCTLAFSDVM